MQFVEPSRIIPKNYNNITGKFSSRKADRLLSYESKLERDFLYIFEYTNYVISILEQPVTINYLKNNKYLKYTPDFYLKTADSYNDIIVEVKYHDDLKKDLKKNKAKYKALNKFAKEKNIDFYLYTERCTFIKSEDHKFNIHFLINYNDISEKHLELISNLFKPYIKISEILNKITSNRYEQMEILNTLWAMIRKQILIVDLYKKLSLNTTLIQLREFNVNVYNSHLKGYIPKGYLI